MKRIKTIVFLLLIVVIAAGALYYLWSKDQEDPITYGTETATTETIVRKTVATGSIVPKEEVFIKPNISGIIEEIYIKAGKHIEAGDLIAKIRVIPNVTSLQSAKNAMKNAKIDLDNQEKVYRRQRKLFKKKVISPNEFDAVNVAYKLAKQSYKSAKQNYEIISTGTTEELGDAANTQIRSTVSGMVLEVPVKEGNQVIESNNFNNGTTIATIADIGKMIFEGKVDESEVGRIKEDLPLEITIGAIENKKFDAILDYIAPKGKPENGAIQFEIKGTLQNIDTTFIRAGLSANASIILEKVENVLALKEALIQYDPTEKPFVEVKIGDQKFEKRPVELGLSDGIFVEVKSGVTNKDHIKVWNQLKATPY